MIKLIVSASVQDVHSRVESERRGDDWNTSTRLARPAFTLISLITMNSFPYLMIGSSGSSFDWRP